MEKTAAFEKTRTEIVELLHRLSAQCERLCQRSPDDLNWAQVGDMGWMRSQLDELVNRT